MKKYIILGISLLTIVIVAIVLLSNKGEFVEGRVVDITINENKENNSSLMMYIDNEPFVVSFNNVDLSLIKLNDIVRIKTDGMIRESYPAQMTGYSIKKLRNDSIMINDENKLNNIYNVDNIVFNTTYFEETLNLKNRFNTLVLINRNEFDDFVSERSIEVPNNIDELFANNIAVVSYTNMTSSGVIDFYGLYENGSNMNIYLKLTTGEVTTTDIVTRGIITFVDKEYESKSFETLTKYIIKNK